LVFSLADGKSRGPGPGFFHGQKKILKFFFDKLSKYKICKVAAGNPMPNIGALGKMHLITEPTGFLKQVRQKCILF
jgi:hypothetical protein